MPKWKGPVLAIACLLLAASVAPTASASEAWPQRPVRLVVPFGAGSATDITARLFAERLAKRWGQPVVVENRPGSDSIVAVSGFVTNRDDHTLLYSAPNPITVNPVMYSKLPYDPEGDLVPISMGSEIFITVAVPESLAVNALPDLLAYAHRQPDQFNWASTPGVVYFMFAGFLHNAGIKVAPVPYRDFVQATNDLAEGRIQTTVTSIATVRPQTEAGKAKLIAVTNSERAPAAPNVPTAAQQGHPELTFGAFGGFFGSRDLPAALRDRIAGDIRAAGADSAIAEKLAPAGIAVRTSTPAEFAAAIADEKAKVAAVAKAVGTKPQQ